MSKSPSREFLPKPSSQNGLHLCESYNTALRLATNQFLTGELKVCSLSLLGECAGKETIDICQLLRCPVRPICWASSDLFTQYTKCLLADPGLAAANPRGVSGKSACRGEADHGPNRGVHSGQVPGSRYWRYSQPCPPRCSCRSTAELSACSHASILPIWLSEVGSYSTTGGSDYVTTLGRPK